MNYHNYDDVYNLTNTLKILNYFEIQQKVKHLFLQTLTNFALNKKLHNS